MRFVGIPLKEKERCLQAKGDLGLEESNRPHLTG